MGAGTTGPEGVESPETTPGLRKTPPYTPADFPAGGAFGDVIEDVSGETFESGDTVQASFSAGHPRNDQKIEESFLFVERETSAGNW